MKKYPEWQKSIREAQEKDRAECKRQDDELAENTRLCLDELGMSGSTKEGAYQRLGHFRFQQWFGDHEDEHLTIERIGLFVPGFKDIGDWRNADINLDCEEDRQGTLVEIAYTLDHMDKSYRLPFFRLFNRRYRVEILDHWKQAIAKRLAA